MPTKKVAKKVSKKVVKKEPELKVMRLDESNIWKEQLYCNEKHI